MAAYNGSVKSIDTSLFDQTIAAFKTAIREFDSGKQAILSSTDTLLSSWEGDGKEAFRKAYEVLRTHLNDESENLQTLANDFESIKETYVEWDRKMSSEINMGNN